MSAASIDSVYSERTSTDVMCVDFSTLAALPFDLERVLGAQAAHGGALQVCANRITRERSFGEPRHLGAHVHHSINLD